jgi:hypothetical protein
MFLVVSTKIPQGLCSSISQENSLYIGRGNFPPRTTSCIIWEDVPLCVVKYSTQGTMGFCFQAPMFLTQQNRQTHTLAAKSLKVTTRYHFMSTKKLMHFDR